MKEHYDVILVGAGLFNAVLAHRLNAQGKSVLILEKRYHIAGNCYTYEQDNIDVHKYGAHIFHTSNKEVWDFVNQFGEFNNFINSPIANYKDEIYNLPFNMNTFSKLFGVITPQQAEEAILREKMMEKMCVPSNLEEQAISMVGCPGQAGEARSRQGPTWGPAVLPEHMGLHAVLGGARWPSSEAR